MTRNRIEPYAIPRRFGRDLRQRLGHVLFAAVRHVVSQVFMIGLDQLAGPSRGIARVALARQVAMYLTATVGDLDHAAVGRLFARDRKTVSYACALIESRRDDPDFDRTITLMQGIVEHLASVSRPPDWATDAAVDESLALAQCVEIGWHRPRPVPGQAELAPALCAPAMALAPALRAEVVA